MNSLLKRAVPHIIAVVVFLVVSVIYCRPALEGKVVAQHDIQGWRGMAQQSFEFKEKYGHMPYWITNMFSGMPTYQTAMETPNKISINYLHQLTTLWLPKPINFFFLACLLMYFLLMVLRVNPWLGVLGGIAYAYSTFDPIIVAVGHDTQMICIAYAPAVIGALLLIFKKRYLTGTVLLALFAAQMLSYNHIQIAYYTLITALCIGIGFTIHSLKNNEGKHVITSGLLALLAGGVAIAINIVTIWPTNELVKETMRGGRSELTDTTNQANKSKGGLDKDYAFQYSYGIGETFTLIVPGMYGGGSGGALLQPGESTFAERIQEAGAPEDYALQAANAYVYWGNQPGTSGPVYLGAVICFLMILGMTLRRDWLTIGIISACIIGIVLAWGKSLPGVNYFLYDHLPLYNKFRAVTMALVIPQLGFVVIACLGANDVLFGKMNKEVLFKALRLSGMITGAVLLILALIYFTSDYIGQSDAGIRQNYASQMLQQQAKGQQPSAAMQQQAEDFAKSLMAGIRADRQSVFGKDLLRTIILIALAAGAIWLYLKNRVQATVAMAVLVLLSSFDLLNVGKRYLNNDNFIEASDFESVFTPTQADLQIKADTTKSFRVFDQTAASGPFSDSRTSYFHQSVGGYSPAKLALYQDIIERQLSRGNMQVFGMLNTRYFISANPANQQPEAHINPDANGNAWFVKGIEYAKNADEEMNLLNTLNTKDSVVIDQRFKHIVTASPVYDSNASIQLIENLNDKISYRSNAATTQFAVFSEVYYPYGWNAFIDDKKVEFGRVDYVLRGMTVPAGQHLIEFRFEPRSVIVGDKITMVFSILMYLGVIAMIYFEYKRSSTVI